jgi:hypothetical protein
VRGLERFAPLVQKVHLKRPTRAIDLRPLGALGNLEELWIEQPISSIEFSGLERLREIHVSHSPDLQALARAPALDRVVVHEGCKSLRDLRPLAGCSVRNLGLFGANSTTALDGIDALPRLDEVHLDVNRRLKSVKAVSKVRALKHFHIYGSRGVDDLGDIGEHPALEVFSLDNGPVLPTFEIFGGMKRLRLFWVNTTNIGPGATRIEPVASQPGLRRLHLRAGPAKGFAAIADVESIAQATGLEQLYLDRMAPIESFAFVAGLTRLKKLTISRTIVHNPDATPIRGLPDLEQLDLSEKVVKRMTASDVVAIAKLLMVNSWGYVYRPAIEAAIAAMKARA